MSTEAARLVAGMLAQRLGVDAAELEASVCEHPLRAAVALSLMRDHQPATAEDPAALVARVASLVGACPACLGERSGCADCGGAGRPGTREPDVQALVRWVAPALQRAGLCVGRRRRMEEDTQRGGYIR